MVFPSRTDTFGLVLLEATACGLPVAACPVTGPRDVIVPGVTGVLADDLHQGAMAVLQRDSEAIGRSSASRIEPKKNERVAASSLFGT